MINKFDVLFVNLPGTTICYLFVILSYRCVINARQMCTLQAYPYYNRMQPYLCINTALNYCWYVFIMFLSQKIKIDDELQFNKSFWTTLCSVCDECAVIQASCYLQSFHPYINISLGAMTCLQCIPNRSSHFSNGLLSLL